MIFETDYANSRQMVSWVLGLGEQARIEGPEELVDGGARAARARRSSATRSRPSWPRRSRRRRQVEPEDDEDSREAPIRPERFARLVTLAGILIDAAREGRKLDVARAVRDASR